MSTKECYLSPEEAWPPASQRGHKAPLQGQQESLGQPRPRPQSIGVSPPAAREIRISRFSLKKKTVDQREPEKGLTYGHCKRKIEKLKKREKKKQVGWKNVGECRRFFFFFFSLPQFLFRRSEICKCYVKAFSKCLLDGGFLLWGCCTPGTHWDGRIKIN